jgi:hypothetical protein
MNGTAPTTELISTAARPSEVVADQMDNWSQEARETHRSILGALDAWSRQTGTSQRLNSWIAEQAVRRSWRR